MLRVSAAETGQTTVLRVAGELDLATADTLREHVRACAGPGIDRLVLDLAGVEFVDVTGLGVFVEAQRLASAHGGTVVLRRPRPMVLRMLDLLKLGSAFELEG
jgi:anti-anti-sigma factor